MKKFNMKSLVMLACVTLLLTFAVSGTVAFLADDSGPVVNEFTPTKVTNEIEEGFDDKTKNKIVINNTSSIPVYIRVAVVGSWMKDGKVVDDWKPEFVLGTDWFEADGLYYYKKQVAAGRATSDLLGSDITATTKDGKVLHVTVLSQAIQGEPASAVEDAWKVTVNDTTKEISK